MVRSQSELSIPYFLQIVRITYVCFVYFAAKARVSINLHRKHVMSFIQWWCERGSESHVAKEISGSRTKKKRWRKGQSRSWRFSFYKYFTNFSIYYYFFIFFFSIRFLPTTFTHTHTHDPHPRPTTSTHYPRSLPTTHDPRHLATLLTRKLVYRLFQLTVMQKFPWNSMEIGALMWNSMGNVLILHANIFHGNWCPNPPWNSMVFHTGVVFGGARYHRNSTVCHFSVR